MASRITTDIPLPTSQTGLLATLRAALVNGAGTIHATHRDIDTGFTLIAGSVYHWEYDTAPDDYRGSVVFYVGTLGAALNFSGVTFKASATIDGTAERVIDNLDAPVSGAGGPGSGDVPVTAATLDDDGDTMYVRTAGGVGIDDVAIQAFVAAEWAANPRTAEVRAETRSLSDGTWREPLMLDGGVTYSIVMSRSGYTFETGTLTV